MACVVPASHSCRRSRIRGRLGKSSSTCSNRHAPRPRELLNLEHNRHIRVRVSLAKPYCSIHWQSFFNAREHTISDPLVKTESRHFSCKLLIWRPRRDLNPLLRLESAMTDGITL